MTGRVSTAAAATLALASASAPRAGWASNASTAGAASGEYGGVRGAGPARRSRPEAGAGHELGRVGIAPLCLMVACLLGGTLICRLGGLTVVED